MGLHLGVEFVAPPGVGIELDADVGKPADQGFGRGIAIDVGQRPVDRQVMAFRRGAENPFHGMIEESAIAGLAGGDALSGVFRNALQQRQHRRQHRHDDQAGDELAAQIGGQPKSHNHAAHENRKCCSKAGRTGMSRILHGVSQGCHVRKSCAENAALPSLLARKYKCSVEVIGNRGRGRAAACSVFVNLDVGAINLTQGIRRALRKSAPTPHQLPVKRAICLREIVRKRTLCLIAVSHQNL